MKRSASNSPSKSPTKTSRRSPTKFNFVPSPLKRNQSNWESLRQQIKAGRGVALPDYSETTEHSEGNHAGMTELFKIRANLVQQENSRMPRLNMVAIKADHNTKVSKKAVKMLSSKYMGGQAQNQDQPMFSKSNNQAQQQAADAVVKKVDHSAMIASFFGDANSSTQNTSHHKNIIVTAVNSAEDSSDFDDEIMNH